MIGSFKNIPFAWTRKISVIKYTRLFVYQKAFSYEEGMLVPPAIKKTSVLIASKFENGLKQEQMLYLAQIFATGVGGLLSSIDLNFF